MKRIYTFLVVALLSTFFVSAESPWRSNMHVKKVEQKSASVTWLPGTLDLYETYDAGGSWELLDSYNYQYEGSLLKVEQTATERVTYTYDECGNWIEKIKEVAEIGADGNIVWTNSERNLREYDSVDPTFQTLKADYSWNVAKGEWRLYYKHAKIVTRNADNNVESVIVRSYLPDESYLDIEGFRVLYDMNGKAEAIIRYAFDYDSWEMVSAYTYQDIEWVECGQILSIDYMCMNDVRAKSYNISVDGKVVASVAITYNEDGLFSCKKVVNDLAVPSYSETYQFTTTDEYGSYDEQVTVKEGATISGERAVEIIDAHGNQCEYSYYMMEKGDWVKYDSILSYYTYDGDKLMETLVELTNPDTGVLEPAQKYIYGNHAQAGVSDLEINNSGETVEYYNLQGIRVDGDFTPGIYIRRQGNNIQKVLR